MALSERLGTPQAATARRPRMQAPKGFEPGFRREAGQAVEATVQYEPGELIGEDEQQWRDRIQAATGLTIPEHRQVELKDTRFWGDPGSPYVYCRFVITDREMPQAGLDVDDLMRAAKAVRRKTSPKPAGTDRALVVAWADLQVGKVGSRGDSEALVERVLSKLDALEAYAKENRCDTALLADVGDCIESVENVASQAHTNDLSVPEQLRLARRLYQEAAIRLARTHSRVVCTGVPSNHGRWRRGKDALGRPGDDYGIETLIAVSDAFALNPEAFGHVSFVVPGVWEETVALDLHGTILAIAHGHQVNRPESIPTWWANQVHGGQPGADADILLTGHFHYARVQPTGRSAHTGRAKWWVQAPTLDNASDWFRLKAGSDSDPALMVFTVDANGWDNLKLL